MKNLLFFIGGGLFVVVASYSTPEIYSCREEVKRLSEENDSLRMLAMEAQKQAELVRNEAANARRLASEATERQRVVADRAQEEALIQAERAMQANIEATRQAALANDYKKQLDACQKKN